MVNCSAFSFIDRNCNLGSVESAIFAPDDVTENSGIVAVWIKASAPRGEKSYSKQESKVQTITE
jgi:hypothetical protein